MVDKPLNLSGAVSRLKSQQVHQIAEKKLFNQLRAVKAQNNGSTITSNFTSQRFHQHLTKITALNNFSISMANFTAAVRCHPASR